MAECGRFIRLGSVKKKKAERNGSANLDFSYTDALKDTRLAAALKRHSILPPQTRAIDLGLRTER